MNTKTALVLIAASLAATACTTTVTAGPAAPPPISLGQENWGTFSPSGPGSTTGTLVVGYNGLGSSVMAWAFSDDGGSTWGGCDALTAGCGAGGGIVPAVPAIGNQGTFWSGDPVVVADDVGRVVMLNLANAPGNPGNWAGDVVASVSTDRGHTFVNTVRVNYPAGGVECGYGNNDQPAAWFDTTVSPAHLWVVWRHADSHISGTGTFGACIRGGVISAADPTTISWDGDPTTVPTNREDIFWGIGGVRVVASQVQPVGGQPVERVTVMYSNTDHSFNDCSSRGVAWETSTIDIGSSSWYSTVRIAHSDTFQWCIAGTSPTQFLGFREFDFAVDRATGFYFAAIHESPNTIGVWVSGDAGGTWQRFHGIVGPSNLTVFLPNIAVDAAGRLTVAYYQMTLSGNVQRFVTASAQGGFNLNAGWSLAILSPSPFTPDSSIAAAGGDYQALFSVPQGAIPSGATFTAAWTQQSALWTAPVQVAP